jgi:hypothetical protein
MGFFDLVSLFIAAIIETRPKSDNNIKFLETEDD